MSLDDVSIHLGVSLVRIPRGTFYSELVQGRILKAFVLSEGRGMRVTYG